MRLVHVHVSEENAQCPDVEITLVRDQMCEKSCAGDVERDTEKQIGTPLIHLHG